MARERTVRVKATTAVARARAMTAWTRARATAGWTVSELLLRLCTYLGFVSGVLVLEQ